MCQPPIRKKNVQGLAACRFSRRRDWAAGFRIGKDHASRRHRFAGGYHADDCAEWRDADTSRIEYNLETQLSCDAISLGLRVASLLVLEAAERTKWSPQQLPPRVPAVPPPAGDVTTECPNGKQDFAEQLLPDDSRYKRHTGALVLLGMFVTNAVAMGIVLRWRDID